MKNYQAEYYLKVFCIFQSDLMSYVEQKSSNKTNNNPTIQIGALLPESEN